MKYMSQNGITIFYLNKAQPSRVIKGAYLLKWKLYLNLNILIYSIDPNIMITTWINKYINNNKVKQNAKIGWEYWKEYGKKNFHKIAKIMKLWYVDKTVNKETEGMEIKI